MIKSIIKTLTLLSVLFAAIKSHAAIFTTQNFKTHLRWNVYSPKDDLVIRSNKNGVSIRSLQSDLISKIYREIKGNNRPNKYIKSVKMSEPDKIRSSSDLNVLFKNKKVEVFSFYKLKDKKYIIDFWIEDNDATDDMDKKLLSSNSKNILPNSVSKLPAKLPKVLKKKKILASLSKNKQRKKNKKIKSLAYRDFRYGASLVWDYPALIPILKKPVSLRIKTPSYFYKIKDIENINSKEKEHLQLSINLYNKEKWGLMYKSIKLYNQKFGTDKNWDINEYLKVNAILKDNIKNNNSSTKKMAMNMLNDILQSTENYGMRRAIYKYLSSYYLESNDYVSILNIAKRFYIDSKKNFDFEESNFAAEMILNGLANLKRIDKVNSLLKEKTIVKLLPKQLLIAYQVYTYMALKKSDKVIEIFNKNRSTFAGNIHEVILYNTAEAYFRLSKFNEAIKLYDKFLSNYSYHINSGHARLRMALSYDFLNKNFKQTEKLYKTAINRTKHAKISYEAKLRYVAFRNLRKKSVNELDQETRVFMEVDDGFKLTKNLLNLKRLVRLRLFVVDKKYSKALSYLKALPLLSMKRSIKRMFESEGGEIINGLIHGYYHNSQYANVIKTWQIYKGKYIKKLEKDLRINFLVGSSYAKLNLFKGFEDHMVEISKNSLSEIQTYPIWFDRKIKIDSAEDMFEELNIIKSLKLKNNTLLKKQILKSKINKTKKNYYLGQYYYRTKNSTMCIKEYEKFLVNNGSENILDLNDIAEVFDQYTDALFKSGNVERYMKMSNALIKDSGKLDKEHEKMSSVREKISYNIIELIAGKQTSKSYLKLEYAIKKFFKDFKKSIFKDRLDYLLAVSMIKNKKENTGIKMLEKLINNKGVHEDIKELSRSELALQKIIKQEV